MMKQRKPQQQSRNNNNDDNNNDDVMMDSNDQEQLVANMAQEMQQQEELINQAFSYVCLGSAALSILFAVWIRECRSSWHAWIQVMGAVMLHSAAWRMVAVAAVVVVEKESSRLHNTSKFQNTYFLSFLVVLAYFLSGAGALWTARRHSSDAEAPGHYQVVLFHQGLLLANALTLAVGMWLRWDHQSIQKSLADLKASQYKYKSL